MNALLSLLLLMVPLLGNQIHAQGSYNKLFIVGGRDSEFKCEVIDLTSQAACSFIPEDFPIRDGSVGTYIEGKPMVCGGYFDEKNCFNFDPLSNSWVETISMNYERRFASAIQLSPGEWWITGSFFTNAGSTTELYTIGEGFTITEDLPDHYYYHSIVKLNSTHVMLVGGSSIKTIWAFDMITREWTQMPDSLHSRYAPAAGSITLPDGSVEVVLVGGNNDVSSEIFSPSTNTWRLGPDIPVPDGELYHAETVQYKDSFLVIGGITDAGGSQTSIYQLDISSEPWHWVQLPQQLQGPRYLFAAFLVPDSFITC